jgi:hypothetical protein
MFIPGYGWGEVYCFLSQFNYIRILTFTNMHIVMHIDIQCKITLDESLLNIELK